MLLCLCVLYTITVGYALNNGQAYFGRCSEASISKVSFWTGKDSSMILREITTVMLVVLLLATIGCGNVLSEGPYQATGIKIGEVTDHSAIVWTRLTQHPERVGSDAPMPKNISGVHISFVAPN